MAKKNEIESEDYADNNSIEHRKEPIAFGDFLENKVVVWNKAQADSIFQEKYFGKWVEVEKKAYLQLSLEESMLLLERGFLEINAGNARNKKMDVNSFYNLCVSIDKEFPQKYSVYRDLRNRGFIVKSGFKFGTHFRVYDRGVNPYKEGAKESKDHTKYNVHAVPENHTMSYQEWSRYVRLSQNIRARALLAVVDEENDVTYYNIKRVRP
ncbi:MAG: tRNA-intron lyase [archaeon]